MRPFILKMVEMLAISTTLCLDVTGRLAHLMTPGVMSVGTYAPGKFNHARLVCRRGARLNNTLGPQSRGLVQC